MKENIYDILTNVNLNLINKDLSKEVDLNQFTVESGERIIDLYPMPIEPILLAKYMENDCGVINRNGDWCTISKKGFDVLKNDGWLEYLKIYLEKTLKTKEDIRKINTGNFSIGQINQGLNTLNNPITINITQDSNKIKTKESNILKFWELISNNKLVSALIIFVITEEIKYGKIWKLIFSFFE